MVWRIGLLTAAGERPYYLCAWAAVWLLRKLSRNMAAALAYVREGSDVCAVAGCCQKHLAAWGALGVGLQGNAFGYLQLSVFILNSNDLVAPIISLIYYDII